MATETQPHPAAPAKDALPLQGDPDHLPSMLLVDPARRLDAVHRWLPLVILAALGLAAFMPWQQSVSGTGRVIAYDPLDRRVNVEARVSGVVRTSRIVEGQRVKAGEVLITLEDNDPNLLENLQAQLADARRRRQSLASRTNEVAAQVRQHEASLQAAMAAARERINASQIAAETAELRFNRFRELFENKRGLVSQQEYELAVLSQKSSAAELAAARANLSLQEATIGGAIANARSLRDSAEAELAAADQQIGALTIQINQTRRMAVEAPRDGIVLSVQATPGTYLRPGSPICVIIPETDSRMVELWLDGNDMPLARARQTAPSGGILTPGSDVRLQFEGWPAVAILGPFRAPRGTFGGEVVFVDPTDNGRGKFRVVVAPNPDEVLVDGQTELERWPDGGVLRQGVRANGWVLAAQVPFWYETWRRLNGFPASPAEDSGKINGPLIR
ncbi:MAG: HlyD family efflux transporter periplasmic adaptor subunit [Verrucomicrobiae bacterium]|nr:HlyD family efflux transporter periplasmic adaptor subunit [Verrucomicrobiae bacterium]